MIDIYLHAPTPEALTTDLETVGLAASGRLVEGSHGHALTYLGPVLTTPGTYDAEGNEVTAPVYLNGVYALLRCLDDSLAGTVTEAAFPGGTIIVDRPEHASGFAGESGPTLAEVVAAKTIELKNAAETVLAPYSLEYGVTEMASWPTQVAEATAYTAYLEALATDPETPAPATPWLDAACAARGMSHADFSARILAKPAVWAAIQGAVNGKRLALQDQVDAIAAGAGTDAEKIVAVRAITWPAEG